MKTKVDTNANIIRLVFDAFARGDVASVIALAHDNVRIVSPGNSALSGVYDGHQGLAAYLGKFGSSKIDYALMDILASENRAIALMRDTFVLPGQVPHFHWACMVFEIDGGKIRTGSIIQDQTAYDQLLTAHVEQHR